MRVALICVCCFLLSCDISQTSVVSQMTSQKNVLGTDLKPCSLKPLTGFSRTGSCQSVIDDDGLHWLCAAVTDSFLSYSASQGNDLRAALPGTSFDGLQTGNKWCLCVDRWIEAYHAGVAPRIVLESTHISALKHIPLDTLQLWAVDFSDVNQAD